jgi:hypothetical protein
VPGGPLGNRSLPTMGALTVGSPCMPKPQNGLFCTFGCLHEMPGGVMIPVAIVPVRYGASVSLSGQRALAMLSRKAAAPVACGDPIRW